MVTQKRSSALQPAVIGQWCAILLVPLIYGALANDWPYALLYGVALIAAPPACALSIAVWFVLLCARTSFFFVPLERGLFIEGMVVLVVVWRVVLLVRGIQPRSLRFGRWLRFLLLVIAATLGIMSLFKQYPLGETISLAVCFAILATCFTTPHKTVAQRTPSRVLWLNAGLIFVSTFTGLLLAELLVRAVFGPPAPTYVQLHPERVWTPRPNSHGSYPMAVGEQEEIDWPFEIGAEGLRERDYGAKKPGAIRVLTLGDSLTFGWGLPMEDGYAMRLEACLNRPGLGQPVEVVNAGVPGYGPAQELNLLEEMGSKFEPDMVVMQLFLGNDIHNDLIMEDKYPLAHNEDETNNMVFYRHGNDLLVRLHLALIGKSALYSFFWRGDNRGFRMQRLLTRLRLGPLAHAPQIRHSADRPYFLETCRKTWDPILEEGWKTVQTHLREMRRWCEERHIPFLIFALPVPTSANPLSLSYHLGALSPNAYVCGKDVDIAEAFFREQGMTYVNVLQTLRDTPDPNAMFLPYDGHLSAMGAQRVADALCPAVINLLRGLPRDGHVQTPG